MPRRWISIAMATLIALGGALVSLPAHAEVDVYTTPGTHNVNGRKWKTECSKYSSVVDRCRTEIWATTVTYNGSRYVESQGWLFNNLTYKTSPRTAWEEWNPLVTPGTHVVNGRTWKTECDTSWTGSNGCRSQLMATVIEKSGSSYRTVNKYVFNNIVHVTAVPCPVTQAAVRTAVKNSTIVVNGCERSKQTTSWTAVDFAVSHSSGEQYYSTAFFRLSGSNWVYAAHSGPNPSTICSWVSRAGVPSDLRDHVPYCA